MCVGIACEPEACMQILEGNSKMLFLQNGIAALGLNVDQGMDGSGTP